MEHAGTGVFGLEMWIPGFLRVVNVLSGFLFVFLCVFGDNHSVFPIRDNGGCNEDPAEVQSYVISRQYRDGMFTVSFYTVFTLKVVSQLKCSR